MVERVAASAGFRRHVYMEGPPNTRGRAPTPGEGALDVIPRASGNEAQGETESHISLQLLAFSPKYLSPGTEAAFCSVLRKLN